MKKAKKVKQSQTIVAISEFESELQKPKFCVLTCYTISQFKL